MVLKILNIKKPDFLLYNYKTSIQQGRSQVLPLDPTGRDASCQVLPCKSSPYYFTTPERGRQAFSCPGNSPANERLSQLSHREATTLHYPSLLQWTLSLQTVLATLPFLYKPASFSFAPWLACPQLAILCYF